MVAGAALVALASRAQFAPPSATSVSGTAIHPDTITANAVDAGSVQASAIVLTTAGSDGITFTQGNDNARITAGSGHYCKWSNTTGHYICIGGFDGPNISLSAAGTTGLVDSVTAPTVTACTSPSITWSTGNALVRFAVGSSCTGVKTATLTFPTAANCWGCSCWDTTTTTNDVRQTGCTSTTAVIGNFGSTIATPTDFTAAESIQCLCRGG